MVERDSKSRVARRKEQQNLRSTEKPRAVSTQSSMNGGGEVVLYEAPDGQIRLDVRLEQDTVWLTQAQMAELFGKNVRTVSEHIRNVFNERELDDSSVIWNFRITARYGRVYETQFYNLDSKGRDVAGRQAVRRLRQQLSVEQRVHEGLVTAEPPGS